MLRTLITCFTLSLTSIPAHAENALEDKGQMAEFAPGATGSISAPITSILRDAEVKGERLKDQLTPQSAANGAFNTIDFDRLREDAMTNARARALLGIDETQGRIATDPQQERYDGKGVFLLASFSMPAPSLQQIMQEAKRFNVPVVFRGFVNNSVYETQTALEEVFGSLGDAVGFSIDPTLFTRFQVNAVPYVVATAAQIDLCETSGCEGDPVPPHDRVGGNVPLEFALRLIVQQGEVAQETARVLLQRR